jgi:hypothetical protein
MTTREQAMQWWTSLDLGVPELLAQTYYKKRVISLRDKEIENIFRKENKTENIYLNRLKEQYKETLKEESNLIKTLRVSNYTGMRNFCLDTELLDFNTIELMESEVSNEVNSSF